MLMLNVRSLLAVFMSIQFALQPLVLLAGPSSNDENPPRTSSSPISQNPLSQAGATHITIETPDGPKSLTFIPDANIPLSEAINMGTEMAAKAGAQAQFIVPDLEKAIESSKANETNGVQSATSVQKKNSFDPLSKTIAFVNMGYEFVFFIGLQNVFASPSEQVTFTQGALMALFVTLYNYLIEFKNAQGIWSLPWVRGGEFAGRAVWNSYDKSSNFIRRALNWTKNSVGENTLVIGEPENIKPTELKGQKTSEKIGSTVGGFIGLVVLFGLIYSGTVVAKYAPAFDVGFAQIFDETRSLTQAGVESGGAFFLYKSFLNIREINGTKSVMPIAFYNTFAQLRYATLGAFLPFMVAAAGTKAPTLIEQSPKLQQIANQAQVALHQLMPFLPSDSLAALRSELVLGGIAMAGALKALQKFLPPGLQDGLRNTAFVTLTTAIPLAATALTGRFDFDQPTISTGMAAIGRLIFSMSSGLGVFLIFFGEDSLRYNPNRTAFLNRIDDKLTPVRNFLGEVLEGIAAIRQNKFKFRLALNSAAPDLPFASKALIGAFENCAAAFRRHSTEK